MKKTILSALFLLCTACLFAQKNRYEPLTTWPYVYEEFRQGRVTNYQGTVIVYDMMNVCLLNGRAHYVKDGVIMEADMKSVSRLEIGGDTYIRVSGYLVKLLAEAGNGAVALSALADTEAMSRTNIGYGNSAVASARNVTVASLNAGMDYVSNRSMDDVNNVRNSGERLAVRETTGICYKGLFVPASKTDVLKISGIDKEAVKDFIKNEKIKFSKVEDLVKLTEFLYSL